MPKVTDELTAMREAFQALRGLKADEQVRALEWIKQKLALPNQLVVPPSVNPAGVVPPPAAPGDSKRFLAQKKPTSNAERVAVLGYHLTKFKTMPHFKTRELTVANTDAAGSKMSNMAQAVKDATRAGYLAPAGRGQKQITVRGEALVEAMPDRNKVKTALEENAVGRARRSKRTTKST